MAGGTDIQSPLRLTERLSALGAARQGQEITLLLQRPGKPAEGGRQVVESVQILKGDSVADVKLKLRSNRQWFSSEHSLAFGDRELLDHEVVGKLTDSSADYLHVYVRLRDVLALKVTGRARTSVEISQRDESTPRSLLTASLAREGSSEGALQVAGAPDTHADTILHLIVRRGTSVGWRSQDDQFELSVPGSATAENVKQRIEATSGVQACSHRLLYNGQVLSSDRPLASYGLGRGSFLDLHPIEMPMSRALPWGSPPLSSPDHGLHEKWQQAREGLATGRTPVLAHAGSGGSYFMSNSHGQNVVVFKPIDEEPCALNNPRSSGGSSSSGSPRTGSLDGYGLKRGVLVGEGAMREVAASLLDHGNFSGVPPTAMVACEGFDLPESPVSGQALADGHKAVKVGSLQAFVTADSDCEETGWSAFPAAEVHKIAILDIRLVNTDRNGSNILAKRCELQSVCTWRLTPIDHGYCLPGSLQDADFEWLSWPQTARPFDSAALSYIAALDADKDLELLNANGVKLRPECERVFKVGTLALQIGASKGCTARQIGTMMTREGTFKSKSAIEKLHMRAVDLALAEEYSMQGQLALSHAIVPRSHFSPMAVGAVADDRYFHHLKQVVAEYFDDVLDQE
ncbi:hypothetical protein WJX73_009691 [Symbiochloris irregularis]|uniref:1-phosphatidylinositol 4-kinase n=1 Tax=Symbiochloris irregularis TaxID=706552 RepID=A0AAW1NUU9_9CHLO